MPRFGVSRSSFYEWRNRSESPRAIHTREIVAAIRASFALSDRTYGSPRIWRELRAQGLEVGRHRVERLMRQNQLIARGRRRRWPKDGGERPVHALAPNVLDRQFGAAAPNQSWAADFTYVWTGEGWLYVAAVLDLYSRCVVGWSMKASMTMVMLPTRSSWRCGAAASRTLLHHSDQGSQYTSEDFQRLLADHGITCSMSRRGDCWDNAAMESFFSTMKTERTARHRITRATRLAPMSSTTSNGSTIHVGAIRRLATSVRRSSSGPTDIRAVSGESGEDQLTL